MAEGIATRTSASMTLDILAPARARHLVLVSDASLRDAIRLLAARDAQSG